MSVPTLNQAKLTDALARIRAADIAIRAHVEERAIAFAVTLPPDGRAKLAGGIERRRARATAMATETQH